MAKKYEVSEETDVTVQAGDLVFVLRFEGELLRTIGPVNVDHQERDGHGGVVMPMMDAETFLRVAKLVSESRSSRYDGRGVCPEHGFGPEYEPCPKCREAEKAAEPAPLPGPATPECPL